jgi:hypothetical protein
VSPCLLLCFQGELVYEVVGELSAPSYFDVDNNGNVFVKQSLRQDIQTEYVVSMSSFYSIKFQLRTSLFKLLSMAYVCCQQDSNECASTC